MSETEATGVRNKSVRESSWIVIPCADGVGDHLRYGSGVLPIIQEVGGDPRGACDE
ncbi:MAG TPA: hypothetical protein VIK11_04740 [Tepidiformaceae bacterium]